MERFKCLLIAVGIDIILTCIAGFFVYLSMLHKVTFLCIAISGVVFITYIAVRGYRRIKK